MSAILTTIKKASEVGVFHRDVSPGNIVLANNEHGEKTGFLIDWHISTMTENPISTKQTGTRIFMASALHDSDQSCHTVAFDIESWFYTFLDIVTNKGLLWRNTRNDLNLRLLKQNFMSIDQFHLQLKHVDQRFKSDMENLRNLLFNDYGRFDQSTMIEDVINMMSTGTEMQLD